MLSIYYTCMQHKCKILTYCPSSCFFKTFLFSKSTQRIEQMLIIHEMKCGITLRCFLYRQTFSCLTRTTACFTKESYQESKYELLHVSSSISSSDWMLFPNCIPQRHLKAECGTVALRACCVCPCLTGRSSVFLSGRISSWLTRSLQPARYTVILFTFSI